MTNPLRDISSQLYDLMSQVESLDPEDLINSEIQDALDTLEDHGTITDAEDLVVQGDTLQGWLDMIVSSIDEASAAVLTAEQALGL